MKQGCFYYVGICLCLTVLGYAGISLFQMKKEDHAAKQEYQRMQRLAEETPEFEQLKKINSDMVGWIKILGTRIDYPVVCGKDNEEYLHKTFSKKKNRSGCIFLDVNCKKDFSSDNSVIYGHHMKDGSMFAELVKFRDPEFVKRHKRILLYLPEKTLSLSVVSAYAAAPKVLPIEFSSIREKERWKAEILKSSESVKGKIKGNVYTFVTCSYEKEDYRTYVHAVEESDVWKESRGGSFQNTGDLIK